MVYRFRELVRCVNIIRSCFGIDLQGETKCSRVVGNEQATRDVLWLFISSAVDDIIVGEVLVVHSVNLVDRDEYRLWCLRTVSVPLIMFFLSVLESLVPCKLDL